MEKVLVLGGARSGKSTFAENWVRSLAEPGVVTYVATSRPAPDDAEWAERIRRHRERRPASWQTRETTDVAAVLRAATGTVIVDCLTLWLTTVLDDAGAWDDDDAVAGPAAGAADADAGAAAALDPAVEVAVDAAVAELVDAWRSSSATIVAVSNEVGWSVVPATPSGRLFRDLLGTLNQRFAAEADRAVLCVAGRALELPGRTPWPDAASGHAAATVVDGGQTGAGRAEATPGTPAPIDRDVERHAREKVDGLAKPPGSLGRLEEIGIWLAARQGTYPPRTPSRIGVTVIGGDHGVATQASAYPPAVTGAMVRTVHAGRAGISALAAAHGATVRVRDLGVDAELEDLPAEITEHKVCRGTGRIDSEDALTIDQARAAIAAGRALAAEELATDGRAAEELRAPGRPAADLLVVGDLGIGNTTVAATLIGAITGLDARKVTGRGTGVDDAGLARKTAIVAAAIERATAVRDDPEALLATVGGADFGAMAGFLAAAAEHGVPVLLDGVVVTAAALVAELITPGAAAWWLAGHRSVEPAHDAALDRLGLEPIVDLRMRLGEGTGALAALPTVRSAVAICTGMAALNDLDLG
ncbi:nicotinate-nucleotide--dimethylbenzimidazole phosphoribosyltransferase [Phytoactinopolyspora halotolerans]|uniref:Nicotinate-nucleotide--dimethylbenzimidazole phosphoribosyltransferase n=2 Tax=Phytoactinopolyspora halotolerans TaxID=1981512 RepID=A0A6L9RZL4_9ACTN|nr:nicotinate-nucleotide--dimethylbenzimidazole phosphoribosyltransferase [Phytoactinopolyspora halotolerans]